MPETVEVRCPVGPQKLFAKLKLGEEFARRVEPGNLMEFTCSDCTRRMRRELENPLLRVFHQFNFLGELVRTRVEPSADWQCTAVWDIL